MKRFFVYHSLLLSLIPASLYAAPVNVPAALQKFFINPHELSPKSIQIDFDGDSTADKILITGLKGSALELSKIETLIRPWEFDKQQVNTTDLTAGSKSNFYIVLSGTKTGYVISDANPV